MLKEKLSRTISLRTMEKLASRISLNAIRGQASKLLSRSKKHWPSDLGFKVTPIKKIPIIAETGELFNVDYSAPTKPVNLFRGHSHPNPFLGSSRYGDRIHFSPAYNIASFYGKNPSSSSGLGLQFITAGKPKDFSKLPLFSDFGMERGLKGMLWREIQKQQARNEDMVQELLLARRTASSESLRNIDREIRKYADNLLRLGQNTYEAPAGAKDLSSLKTYVTVPSEPRIYGNDPKTKWLGKIENPLIQATGDPRWEELLSDIVKYYRNNSPSQQYYA